MGSAAQENFLHLQSVVNVEEPIPNDIKFALEQFAEAVKEGGPAQREQIIGVGAYDVILRAWGFVCYAGANNVKLFHQDALEGRDATLRALYALTAGFPEIIDDAGWEVIQQSIDSRMPETTLTLAMRVIRNICVKSEANREHITWKLEMIPDLVKIMRKAEKQHFEFVREWCGAMKALLLQDDLRVSYNRAPERKRKIFQENCLPLLVQHLETFEGDEGTLNAVVVFLGSMAVNEDHCISIESGNVFPSIVRMLKAHPQNKMLVKNTISFLRYLNICQVCRERCNAFAVVKWVLQLMLAHKHSNDVLEVAMSCLAFMTLRNACHVAQLLASNGVQIILDILSSNTEEVPLLKAGCLILRNVAANGAEKGRSVIIAANGEAALISIAEKFPDLTDYYVKPALRDLGVLNADGNINFKRKSADRPSRSSKAEEGEEEESDEKDEASEPEEPSDDEE